MRMRTRVKICGITSVGDARTVVDSGADALGLVFYSNSPRYVTLEQARDIALSVAPFVTLTGLFVNAEPDAVHAVLDAVPLGLLQFHGTETNGQCNGFGLPFIKSIPMRAGIDVLSVMESYPDAAGLLLDSWQPGVHGGSGIAFDWDQVPGNTAMPLILAGGLTADNVNTAIRQVRPYAVDVSSGVERAKGIKSAEKIHAFMRGVQQSGTDTGSS